MEFHSSIFFAVSYYISSFWCTVGFLVLISSNSNSDDPLSNLIIFALTYLMFLFSLISSAYAFLLRPSLENGVRYMPTIPPDVMIDRTWLEQVCHRIIYLMVGPPFNRNDITGFAPLFLIYFTRTWFCCLLIASTVQFVKTLDPMQGFFLLPLLGILCRCISLDLDPVPTYLLVKERFSRWGTWPPFMWIYGIRKIMKFALGMAGTILFQYFFRSPSTRQLVAFLCLTVAWLGNLALVRPSTDLGIFNFLLVNACLSCAVGLYNLNIGTWLVFAACILLYFLREMLGSVTLTYDRMYRPDPEQDQVPQTPPSLTV